MDKIYFDHNSTMELRKEIREFIYNFELAPYNASSTHYYGRKAKEILNNSREKLLELTEAGTLYKVIFTSSATESNISALHNFREKIVVSSPIEHPSIINNLNKLNHILLKVDETGIIDLENYIQQLKLVENKGFVTIMMANNETGVIQDIKLLAEIAHKYNCIFHTDATQAFGKIPVNLEKINADLVTISSHKIGGPVGVAALIYKSHLKLEALLQGGGQEFGLRSGTENIISIAAFIEAYNLAKKETDIFYQETLYLRNYLEKQIREISDDVIFFSHNVKKLPNSLSFTMPDVSAETQIINFDLANIMISAGSACSSGKIKNSYILKSMGFSGLIADTAIRVSFGLNNNIKEVDYFIEKWKELYLRSSKKKKIA